MANDDHNTGFQTAPARYSAGSRETIDVIRDALGQYGFLAYCHGQVIKYEARAGLKGPEEEDREKARFYRMMHQHALGVGPDPREYRVKPETDANAQADLRTDSEWCFCPGICRVHPAQGG